ncbi:lysozyme inhibitor LprI family protein [Niveispirillum lacus]|nr:lysozyme inhibitor LprI family protein [Niveispirillum lacus]
MRCLSAMMLVILFGITPAYADDCENAVDQAAMNTCAAEAYAQADKQLNERYKEVMATLDPARQDALKQAQRDWIKYRDSHCKAEAAAVQGGTMYGAVLNACLAETTKDRVEKLK